MEIIMHMSNLSLFGGLFDVVRSTIPGDKRKALFKKMCIEAKKTENHILVFTLEEDELDICIKHLKSMKDPKSKRLIKDLQLQMSEKGKIAM